jgi:3-oxoacyl-[acyl-carrier protein] reductase
LHRFCHSLHLDVMEKERTSNLDLGIGGKTALVLAAGGGLGGAIAATLAREGAHVAAADLTQALLSETVDKIKTDGGTVYPVCWDLADLAAMHAGMDEIDRKFGAVDILVNITGGPSPTLAQGQDPGLWSKHFQSMVLSIIALTDQVLPSMKKRGWGRIVTSTSSGVVSPIANLGISNALRSALLGWSKTLAREVGPHGVTANIVLPGRIATKRITFLDEQKAKREGRKVEEVLAESTSSIPVGRYGEPQEYADAVAFLASARASYINGSVIRVDGGLIASI